MEAAKGQDDPVVPKCASFFASIRYAMVHEVRAKICLNVGSSYTPRMSRRLRMGSRWKR